MLYSIVQLIARMIALVPSNESVDLDVPSLLSLALRMRSRLYYNVLFCEKISILDENHSKMNIDFQSAFFDKSYHELHIRRLQYNLPTDDGIR